MQVEGVGGVEVRGKEARGAGSSAAVFGRREKGENSPAAEVV